MAMGLDGRVDVVQDTYGWPHIYATSLHDASYVEGVMSARHRMPEMELLRRVASGTLAEAFGSLSPGLIDDDIAIRVIGLRRAAVLMWDQIQAMAPSDPLMAREKVLLEAYAAGVNWYLQQIRDGLARTPSGTEIVVNDATPDWTPVDSLVLGRYQSYSLSYDVDDDIHLSQLRDAANTTFEMADMTTQAAQYARRGFFEMAWIVALVVPVIVVTRGGVRDDARAAKRHTRLAIPLILLLGAMILSAALRMRMYVQYYGLTLDRLYPMVFMGWLAIVLGCLAATVVRGRGRLLVATAFAAGVTIVAALHVVDPDALVARVNVARANVARANVARANVARANVAHTNAAGGGDGSTDGALDVRYLARLDGGAVAIATAAILSPREQSDVSGDATLTRCAAAQMLLQHWGPTSPLQARATGYAAWRFWNFDDARAVRVVNAHRERLRALVPHDCLRELRARDAARTTTQR
jgi:hypothetical protein